MYILRNVSESIFVYKFAANKLTESEFENAKNIGFSLASDIVFLIKKKQWSFITCRPDPLKGKISCLASGSKLNNDAY